MNVILFMIAGQDFKHTYQFHHPVIKQVYMITVKFWVSTSFYLKLVVNTAHKALSSTYIFDDYSYFDPCVLLLYYEQLLE